MPKRVKNKEQKKAQAKQDKVQNKGGSDSKLFAFLAVLLSVIGFVIAYVAKKDDEYVMFYAKQSLILFFAWIVAWIVDIALGLMPVLGSLVTVLVYLAVLVLWIFGLVYSLSGEMKEVPIIGQFARNI